MEEIWNYAVTYDGKDKVYLAVWGSGVLEYDITHRPLEGVPRSRRRDGDRPLPRRRHHPRDRHRREPRWTSVALGLDLLRRLAATTAATGAASPTRRAACPPTSTTTSRPAARRRPASAPTRALGVVTDAPPTSTWVAYTRDPKTRPRQGRWSRATARSSRPSTCRLGVPHSFMIAADVDGNDIWVGTAQGPRLGHRRRLLPGPEASAPTLRQPRRAAGAVEANAAAPVCRPR